MRCSKAKRSAFPVHVHAVPHGIAKKGQSGHKNDETRRSFRAPCPPCYAIQPERQCVQGDGQPRTDQGASNGPAAKPEPTVLFLHTAM